MGATRVKCPTCRREIDWSSCAHRPFCSERCRLIDLGAWLSEKHAIPGDAPAELGDGNEGPGAAEDHHGPAH